MEIKRHYGEKESVEIGDIVVMDLEKHDSFSTCIVCNVDPIDKLVYLERPHARTVYGRSNMYSSAYVTCERYAVSLTKFRKHYKVFVTGISAKKQNRDIG